GHERITELVDLKLDGVFDGLAPGNPFDSPETGPVYQIVTRPPPCAPAVVRWLYPGGRIDDPQAEESYRRVFARLDAFNHEAIKLTHRWGVQRGRAAGAVVNHSDFLVLPDAARCVVDRFTLADALANRFRSKHLRSLRGLLVLAFIWTCFFQAHLVFGDA